MLPVSHTTDQVKCFIVEIVFQRFLKLSDHGFHKLAAKVVVPCVEETH